VGIPAPTSRNIDFPPGLAPKPPIIAGSTRSRQYGWRPSVASSSAIVSVCSWLVASLPSLALTSTAPLRQAARGTQAPFAIE
jgi:hypothetical protein